MIRWQIELLWPVVVALLAFVGFALYVFIHTDRLYRLKLLLIPGVLAMAAFSFTWFGHRLGYAYPEGLPRSFEYVAHRVILVENRKAWVDVLVVSRQPLERDARLHRLPWSKKLEDALKQAHQMQKGGGRVEMGRGNGDEYPEGVPRRVLPQDDVPKDPLPREGDMLAPQGPSI
jgi:hypothetical protein